MERRVPPRPNWFAAWPVEETAWLRRVPPAPPAVRAFRAEDLHVTIAFFGDVSAETAERGFRALEAVGEEADGGAQPTRIRLGAVRLMGSPRRGSALSAVAAADDPGMRGVLGWMARARDAALAAAGARPDDRPPLPHVTLARIQRRADRDARRRAIDWADAIDLGAPTIALARPALYTWAEDRSERLFRIVRRAA